jgi:hypothetical protein
MLNLTLSGSSAVATGSNAGSILTLVSSTTGFTAATQSLAYIYSSGANGTASAVVSAMTIKVANTGTTSNNTGMNFQISGATTNIGITITAQGGTTNTALQTTAGTASFSSGAYTVAGVAGTTYNPFNVAAYTITTSTQTTISALNGLTLNLGSTTVAQSGGAVTVTTASALYISAITVGTSVTITNNYLVNTSVAGCFCTAAGVWTSTSSRTMKTDIQQITDWDEVLRDIQLVHPVRAKYIDNSDGGFNRYSLIAEEVPDFLAMPTRLGLAPSHVAAFAVAGVCALWNNQQTIDKRLFSVENRIKQLEAEIEELRKESNCE